MKRISYFITSMCLLIACLLSFQVHALSISLDTSSTNIDVGDTVFVDLNVSGLGDLSSPSLGAFLVELDYDDSILSYDSVNYGSYLGTGFDIDILTTSSAGSISLDEFSFLTDLELDALQPDNFTLATLGFTGLAGGLSAINYGLIDLSDAEGFSIVNPTLLASSVMVGSASVPEPAPLLLMALGLSGLLIRNRSKTKIET